MKRLCEHPGCKRAAHYGKECCGHAQLSLALQLPLLDASGQLGLDACAEEPEEEGTPACPIQDCGAPSSQNGLCAVHYSAALRLRIETKQAWTQVEFDAINAAGAFDQEHASERALLAYAKLRLRIGTAMDGDRKYLREHAEEVNGALARAEPTPRKPKGQKPADPDDQALDELEKKLAVTEAEAKRLQKRAEKKPALCGEKAAKGNAQGCIHPKGHAGVHSDTTRTWRTRKRAPKPSDPGFPVCAVSNCASPARAAHLCATHYRKARSLGIPTTGTYSLAQVDQLSGRTPPPKRRRA